MRVRVLLTIAASLALAGPTVTSRPTITGTLQQGKKLTANPGSWSGHGTISYRYQWYRCNPVGAKCGSIHGATLGTYVQVRADVGRALAVTVSASVCSTSPATWRYVLRVAPLIVLQCAPCASQRYH